MCLKNWELFVGLSFFSQIFPFIMEKSWKWLLVCGTKKGIVPQWRAWSRWIHRWFMRIGLPLRLNRKKEKKSKRKEIKRKIISSKRNCRLFSQVYRHDSRRLEYDKSFCFAEYIFFFWSHHYTFSFVYLLGLLFQYIYVYRVC